MEATMIDLEVFDNLSEAKQTCYILCGRNPTEDCKKDMGLSCQMYDATFQQMYVKHGIGDNDSDAWEPHEETIEEEEDEADEADVDDSLCDECDEVIDIKLKSDDSVSSVYADEDT